MTYPTPEEINQIAKECGFSPIAIDLRSEQLQAFFLRGIEMGRKIESDLMAELAIRNNTGE